MAALYFVEYVGSGGRDRIERSSPSSLGNDLFRGAINEILLHVPHWAFIDLSIQLGNYQVDMERGWNLYVKCRFV